MGRTFACSDLHGMIELYHQIKNFLQPDDKVYFLGDAGDRGTDCWKTLKTILDDPQFIFIIGNHEDMLYSIMQDVLIYNRLDHHNLALLFQNGGTETYEGWSKESFEIQQRYFYKIKKLPVEAEYKNKNGKRIFLSHAGFTPDPENLNWHGFNVDLIWNRQHIMHAWPHDIPKDWIVIHGHTPIEYVIDELQWKDKDLKQIKMPKAFWYADGHKCCIDCGSFYTNCTVLLDLDTFEEHYFYTKDYK